MNKEQAIKWAKKQKNRKGTNVGYVSMYDFDIEKAESYNQVLFHTEKSLKYLKFIGSE